MHADISCFLPILYIDDSLTEAAPKLVLHVLQSKAALLGVASGDIVDAIHVALSGQDVTSLHDATAKYAPPLRLGLPAEKRNRIEGVTVTPEWMRNVLAAPRPVFRDRDEEEIRGYRDALKWIHEHHADIPVSEETIRQLHRMTRGVIWDAGHYKEKDGDIIERYADGRERVRFKTVTANEIESSMATLVADWQRCLDERWAHPLVAMAAFNLDFLCIHPFRDGNGRVSRLLLLLQCYHIGLEVGRYISLERVIEQNKERYYETLEQSSQSWHESKHDPWPYINYLLFILKNAYRELVDRVGDTQAPRGAKTELVIGAISALPAEFTLAQLELACPGVSRDMVRRVLNDEKGKTVECIGRGPGAKWQKKG